MPACGAEINRLLSNAAQLTFQNRPSLRWRGVDRHSIQHCRRWQRVCRAGAVSNIPFLLCGQRGNGCWWQISASVQALLWVERLSVLFPTLQREDHKHRNNMLTATFFCSAKLSRVFLIILHRNTHLDRWESLPLWRRQPGGTSTCRKPHRTVDERRSLCWMEFSLALSASDAIAMEQNMNRVMVACQSLEYWRDALSFSRNFYLRSSKVCSFSQRCAVLTIFFFGF